MMFGFNWKMLQNVYVNYMYVNFLRGRKRLSHINQLKNFWLEETLRQLGTVLAMARRRTR
jgi:hypothetical protein